MDKARKLKEGRQTDEVERDEPTAGFAFTQLLDTAHPQAPAFGCLEPSSVIGLWIEAGLVDISDLRVTAVSVIVIVVYAVALHVTNSILLLPVVAGPQLKAVPAIVARPRMVALGVT
ncbi:hypothetical protein EYF80_012423 [Liparis tanakae]|uniref:Uncharacterized protein n=1 Tax=Liparis tanakae TaxID=230148 RepID=A0A4Z2IH14_9TELE|nr:hypothetical protein EYF80_012423 [Liparis tanakae]